MATIREELIAMREAHYLTVRQVALLTQYDPQTVYRKAAKREIPGLIRFGRSIRFVRSAVLRWKTDRDQTI